MSESFRSPKEFHNFIDKFSEQLIGLKDLVTEVYKLKSDADSLVDAIGKILKRLDLPVETFRESTVVSSLPGTLLTPALALRVALNDTSQFSGAAFSKTMIEITIALGTLTILDAVHEDVKGGLKVIFEFENPQADASTLLQTEVLHNVHKILVLNTNPDIPAGSVGLKFGAIFPAKDEFSLKIYKNSYSYAADSERNVVQAAAHIITGLNQSFTRKVNPLTPLKVTISSIQTTQSNSGMANSVNLQGFFQTVAPAMSHEIPGLLEDILHGIAKAYGVDFHLEMTTHSSPISSDELTTRNLQKSAEGILGKNKVILLEYPHQISATFSKYLEKVSGAVLEVGIGTHKENPQRFDDAIQAGIKVLTRAYFQQEW